MRPKQRQSHAGRHTLHGQAHACGVFLMAVFAGPFEGHEHLLRNAMRAAQRIAQWEAPLGWCAEEPNLDRFPVRLYTDVTSAAAEAHTSEALGGTGAAYKLMLLPNLTDPSASFKPPHGMQVPTAAMAAAGLPGTKYKWWRPQILANSPFEYALSLDVDAVPCGANALAALFQRFHALRSERRVVLAAAEYSFRLRKPDAESAELWQVTKPEGISPNRCKRLRPRGSLPGLLKLNGGIVLAHSDAYPMMRSYAELTEIAFRDCSDGVASEQSLLSAAVRIGGAEVPNATVAVMNPLIVCRDRWAGACPTQKEPTRCLIQHVRPRWHNSSIRQVPVEAQMMRMAERSTALLQKKKIDDAQQLLNKLASLQSAHNTTLIELVQKNREPTERDKAKWVHISSKGQKFMPMFCVLARSDAGDRSECDMHSNGIFERRLRNFFSYWTSPQAQTDHAAVVQRPA